MRRVQRNFSSSASPQFTRCPNCSASCQWLDFQQFRRCRSPAACLGTGEHFGGDHGELKSDGSPVQYLVRSRRHLLVLLYRAIPPRLLSLANKLLVAVLLAAVVRQQTSGLILARAKKFGMCVPRWRRPAQRRNLL